MFFNSAVQVSTCGAGVRTGSLTTLHHAVGRNRTCSPLQRWQDLPFPPLRIPIRRIGSHRLLARSQEVPVELVALRERARVHLRWRPVGPREVNRVLCCSI